MRDALQTPATAPAAAGPGPMAPGRSERPTTVTGTLGEVADLVAFKHSVFAMPFALMALITAAGQAWPAPRVWLWTLVAMVAARTTAMGFNRLVDHAIDAANRRTAGRSLPAGRLSRRFAWLMTAAAGGLFVVAAARLNELCLALAAPTLVWLLGYSYAKRFTAFVLAKLVG